MQYQSDGSAVDVGFRLQLVGFLLEQAAVVDAVSRQSKVIERLHSEHVVLDFARDAVRQFLEFYVADDRHPRIASESRVLQASGMPASAR